MNEVLGLLPVITALQLYTASFSAFFALEVHMLMTVVMLGFPVRTKCVLRSPAVIQYFVDQIFVQKSLKRTINGHPVKLLVEGFFQVGVGQGNIFIQKFLNDLQTAIGNSKFVGL